MPLTVNEIEQLIPRWRKLKPFEGKSDEEVRQAIMLKEQMEADILDFNAIFPKPVAEYLAEEQRKIMTLLGIDTPDDKPGLHDFLYLSGHNKLIQKDLSDLQKKLSDSKHTITETEIKTKVALEDQLRKNTTELREWRKQLGMDVKAKDDETPTSLLEKTIKEAREYIDNHKHEYQWMCPQCKSLNILGVKHWAFDDDKQVWNDDLFLLTRTGNLSLNDVAHILRTSPEAIARVAVAKKLISQEEIKAELEAEGF